MIVMGLCVVENDSKDERSQRLRCRKPGQQGVYTSDESRIHQGVKSRLLAHPAISDIRRLPSQAKPIHGLQKLPTPPFGTAQIPPLHCRHTLSPFKTHCPFSSCTRCLHFFKTASYSPASPPIPAPTSMPTLPPGTPFSTTPILSPPTPPRT